MTNYLELYLISFNGVLAVAYSYLICQILSAGRNAYASAEAIQIGAKAYLNRYKMIAIVGIIVLAIVTYFLVI